MHSALLREFAIYAYDHGPEETASYLFNMIAKAYPFPLQFVDGVLLHEHYSPLLLRSLGLKDLARISKVCTKWRDVVTEIRLSRNISHTGRCISRIGFEFEQTYSREVFDVQKAYQVVEAYDYPLNTALPLPNGDILMSTGTRDSLLSVPLNSIQNVSTDTRICLMERIITTTLGEKIYVDEMLIAHDKESLFILGSLTPPNHAPREENVYRVSLKSFVRREGGGWGATRDVLEVAHVWAKAVLPYSERFSLDKMTIVGVNLLLFHTSDDRFLLLTYFDKQTSVNWKFFSLNGTLDFKGVSSMVVLNDYLYVSMQPEKATAARSWSNILVYSCKDIISELYQVPLVRRREFPNVRDLTIMTTKGGFLLAGADSFPFWLYEKTSHVFSSLLGRDSSSSSFGGIPAFRIGVPALIVLSPDLDVMSFYGGKDLPFGLVFEKIFSFAEEVDVHLISKSNIYSVTSQQW